MVPLGRSLEGGKIPKPRVERQLSLACGSLGECAQYPAGGSTDGNQDVTGLKPKQSLYLEAGTTVGGGLELMFNSN